MKTKNISSALLSTLILITFSIAVFNLNAALVLPPAPPSPDGSLVGAPVVQTVSVANVGIDTAIVSSNLTLLGNPSPTSHGVCWSTTANPTISGNKIDKGAATVTGTFDIKLTGLSAGTTYHVRSFATNSVGTVYGEDKSFTTQAVPVITWSNPTDIVYGTLLSGTQLNASSTVSGTFQYFPASGTKLSAGNNQNLVVVFTPTDAVTYSIAKDTVKINVAKANPVISWSNPADIVYGTTLSATQLSATADVAGSFAYSPATGVKLNAGSGQDLTTTFTPTDGSNYNVIKDTVKINVAKANPVISWSNPADIVYGTTLSATQLAATADVAGSFAYSPATGVKLNAGTSQNLTTIFTPTDAANYNAAKDTVKINVAKANPVISWSNPADIVYGTTLSATQLAATADVAGSFTYSPATGAKLNAGSGQDLTTIFTPTDAANYNTAKDTVKINVAKANPVISWSNPADIVYGTTLSATQLAATADVAGSFAYSPATGVKLNAGSGQNLTTTFTPTDGSNYNVIKDTVKINVSMAIPVISWQKPADIKWGTPLSGEQQNATTTVPGVMYYIPESGTILEVGDNQELEAYFIPTDRLNYHPKSEKVSISVKKATPVIIWNNPVDIRYGDLLTPRMLNAKCNVSGTFVYNRQVGYMPDAGYNQKLTVTFTPNDQAHYEIAHDTVYINVLRVNTGLVWNNPSPIRYGTSLSEAQLNAISDTEGRYIYNPAVGTKLEIGAGQKLTVKFIPKDTINYTTKYDTVNIDVLKGLPVITWPKPKDIVYGTLLSEAQLNATVNVEGSLKYNYTLGSKLVAGKDLQIIASFIPADTSRYESVSDTLLLTVLKANYKTSWNKPADIDYGTALSEVQHNAVSDIPGQFYYYPKSGVKLNAGFNQPLYSVFVPEDSLNFNYKIDTVYINVHKAVPVINWSKPGNFVYGKSLDNKELNAVVNNAEGQIIYKPGFGEILNAGKSVKLTCSFVPTDQQNFQTVYDTVTVDIAKAIPTIKWSNPSDITYGKRLNEDELNAVTSVNGMVIYLPNWGSVPNAGSNQILTVTLLPEDTTNYVTARDTVYINVKKANPVITWNTPLPIRYGTRLDAAQLNATSNIGGDFIYTPGYASTPQVGDSVKLSVEFIPLDATNYNKATSFVYLKVYDDTALDKIYMQSLEISPNPVTSGFRVERLEGDAKLSIYDYSGKLVKTENVSSGNQVINVDDLNSGLYMVRIVTGRGEARRKLIKN